MRRERSCRSDDLGLTLGTVFSIGRASLMAIQFFQTILVMNDYKLLKELARLWRINLYAQTPSLCLTQMKTKFFRQRSTMWS